jgi:ribosomal protein S18 acetylase RimI-like enzyme
MKENAQPAVHIRRAKEEDAVSIAAVLYEAFEEYQPFYTPEAFGATTPSAEQIRNRLDEGPAWAAFEEEKIVGTVSAVISGTALYIRSMAVLPAARGRGLGRKLLEYTQEYANENGIERLRLSTTPFLARAIRLYERYGFQKNEEGPHELYGTPLFTMVKMLREIT